MSKDLPSTGVSFPLRMAVWDILRFQIISDTVNCRPIQVQMEALGWKLNGTIELLTYICDAL